MLYIDRIFFTPAIYNENCFALSLVNMIFPLHPPSPSANYANICIMAAQCSLHVTPFAWSNFLDLCPYDLQRDLSSVMRVNNIGRLPWIAVKAELIISRVEKV